MKLILQFLLGITLLVLLTLAQADQSPMGWQSRNGTLDELWNRVMQIQSESLGMTQDQAIDQAIKELYVEPLKQSGERI